MSAGCTTAGNEASQTTYDLELILPKLLLPGLIQKWKVSHMMDEDIAKDRKL
jgi:hypothetical protein